MIVSASGVTHPNGDANWPKRTGTSSAVPTATTGRRTTMSRATVCGVHASDFVINRYCEAALEIGPSEDGRCRFVTFDWPEVEHV